MKKLIATTMYMALLLSSVGFTLAAIQVSKTSHELREAMAEQQEAKRLAAIERQCALAWPLLGDNFDECIDQ